EIAEQFIADLHQIREQNSNPLDALRQALLGFVDFGFDNPNQYKVFFLEKSDVYGSKKEFMERESMRRDSYLEFRKIVEACIKAGKLRRMNIDLLTQVLATP